jgi:hypothetical protein
MASDDTARLDERVGADVEVVRYRCPRRYLSPAPRSPHSMMPLALFFALRFIHIVVGVFWVGTLLFIALYLLPTMRAIGPAGGPVMQELTQVRRLPTVLLLAGILTVLSGLTLYWNDSAGFHSKEWLASGTGMTFGFGAVMAILTLILGSTVNSPTAKRLGALGASIRAAGAPPTPEQAAQMQALQNRLYNAQRLTAVLLLLATAAMSVARYVR